MRTPLVGKSLRESGLRNATGANVIGLWERGKFVLPAPDTVFTDTMVMVIAGTYQQIDAVNHLLGPCDPAKNTCNDAPVVILGWAWQPHASCTPAAANTALWTKTPNPAS